MLYSHLKPKYAQFTLVNHYFNDIALAVIETFFKFEPRVLTAITGSIIGTYGLLLICMRPFDAVEDMVIELLMCFGSLSALLLSELELSDFANAWLWVNTIMMIVIALFCLWPLTEVITNFFRRWRDRVQRWSSKADDGAVLAMDCSIEAAIKSAKEEDAARECEGQAAARECEDTQVTQSPFVVSDEGQLHPERYFWI